MFNVYILECNFAHAKPDLYVDGEHDSMAIFSGQLVKMSVLIFQ